MCHSSWKNTHYPTKQCEFIRSVKVLLVTFAKSRGLSPKTSEEFQTMSYICPSINLTVSFVAHSWALTDILNIVCLCRTVLVQLGSGIVNGIIILWYTAVLVWLSVSCAMPHITACSSTTLVSLSTAGNAAGYIYTLCFHDISQKERVNLQRLIHFTAIQFIWVFFPCDLRCGSYGLE